MYTIDGSLLRPTFLRFDHACKEYNDYSVGEGASHVGQHEQPASEGTTQWDEIKKKNSTKGVRKSIIRERK